jgi:hypothetical protein
MYAEKMEVRPRRGFTKDEAEMHILYDAENGLIRWKNRVQCFGGGRSAGDIAGTNKDGYTSIKMFGKFYRSHHLVWLMETGDWPPLGVDIDHINRDRGDSRFSNLRLATRAQNNLNSQGRRDNKSGHRGVHPTGDKWFARISVDKKIIHLGVFSDKSEAISARKEAEKKFYPEFSQGDSHEINQ